MKPFPRACFMYLFILKPSLIQLYIENILMQMNSSKALHFFSASFKKFLKF